LQIFTPSAALDRVEPRRQKIHCNWKRSNLGNGGLDITLGRVGKCYQQKGLFFLFQAQTGSQAGRITQNWISSEELELTGHLQVEWCHYRHTLINNGVYIQAKQDTLKWAGGNSTGKISVKNIYLASENMKRNYCIGGWRKAMWDWNVPLKIKLFTWLVVENKILSWENLQRRGFSGPGICTLCKLNEETTQHLFLDCAFMVEVWRKLKSTLNYSGSWAGANLSECFK
jgi:hypothetical protein